MRLLWLWLLLIFVMSCNKSKHDPQLDQKVKESFVSPVIQEKIDSLAHWYTNEFSGYSRDSKYERDVINVLFYSEDDQCKIVFAIHPAYHTDYDGYLMHDENLIVFGGDNRCNKNLVNTEGILKEKPPDKFISGQELVKKAIVEGVGKRYILYDQDSLKLEKAGYL